MYKIAENNTISEHVDSVQEWDLGLENKDVQATSDCATACLACTCSRVCSSCGCHV